MQATGESVALGQAGITIFHLVEVAPNLCESVQFGLIAVAKIDTAYHAILADELGHILRHGLDIEVVHGLLLGAVDGEIVHVLMEQGELRHVPAVKELDHIGEAVVVGARILGDLSFAAEVRADLHGRHVLPDAAGQGLAGVGHVRFRV